MWDHVHGRRRRERCSASGQVRPCARCWAAPHPGRHMYSRTAYSCTVLRAWHTARRDDDEEGSERMGASGMLFGLFGLERIEVANAVATQATIKTRARGLRAKKLAGDGQQIIQGQKQRLSEFDHDLFLSGCERGLKPLRGVGRVMEVVSALPFVDGAFTHTVTQRQSCSGVRAGRHLR